MIDPQTFEAAVPAELRDLNRWVGWAPDPTEGPTFGRAKCPVILSRRSRRASTRKSDTWGSFQTALAFYRKYGAEKGTGVGFVFTQDDGLVYVDVDDALNEDGSFREWCRQFIDPFIAAGAYVEASPSGRGLHLIGRGKLPEGVGAGGKANFPQHKSGDKVPEVAIFQAGKYTTLTARRLSLGAPLGDCTAAAAEVWAAAGINATGIDAQAGEAPADADLPKVDKRKVPRAVMAELEACTASSAEDRSAARFKLYAEAAQKLDAEEIFALVLGHDEWYQGSGAASKSREATWVDIVRSSAKAETARREFQNATEVTAGEQAVAADDWKSLGVAVTSKTVKGGAVEHEAVYGAYNIATVLARHPEWQERLRLNTFKEKIFLDGREMVDEDAIKIAEAVRKYLRWGQEPRLDLVRQGAALAARDHAFNPLQDFLRGITWDGTSRLDGWLARTGCEDTKLNRVIGRKWMISLVARALDPGCKVDTVLIIEGDQGKKKSTLFRAIAGGSEYFTDAHVTFDKDGQMIMHGNWIIELAELATLRQAEQDRTKQFVAARDLTFRAPYAATTITRPRHFVLVGSTNEDEYLRDATGNRRYWPVSITGVLDVAWVEANREQLLAEAVVAFSAGEHWWFEEGDEATRELREAQSERMVGDTLETKVRQFIEENVGIEFELATIMDAIGVDCEDMSKAKRVGNALRKIGYAKRRTRSGSALGVQRVIWYDPLLAEDDRHEAEVIPLKPREGLSLAP